MNKFQNLINFKHIAKGRNANNTFAKSLKCTIFNFACVIQKRNINKRNGASPHFFLTLTRLTLLYSLLPIISIAQASPKIDSLQKLFNDKKEDAEILCLIAKEYSKISPDSCEVYARKALILAQSKNDINNISRSYQAIAYFYSTVGEIDSAYLFYNKSDSLNLKVTEPLIKATCNIQLGYLNLLDRNAKMANEKLQKAKTYLEVSKEGELKYKSLMQYNQYMAVVFDQLGAFDQSIIYCHEALKNANLSKDERFIALANATLGNTYHGLKEWRKSLSYQLKAIEITKTIKDNINLQSNFLNAGKCYAQLNSFDTCRKYLDSSKAILMSLKNPIRLATLYKEYGKMYSFSKNVDSAKLYFNKAIEIFTSEKKDGYNGDCFYWIGNLNKEVGDYKNAVTFYNKAIPIYKEQEQKAQLVDAYHDLAYCENKLGHTAIAYDLERQGRVLMDTVYSEEKQNSIVANEIKYETSIKEAKIKQQATELKLSNTKNIFFLGGGILALCGALGLGFLYKRVRKQKKLIEFQKQEIFHNNSNSLKQLINIFKNQTTTNSNTIENQERMEALSLLNRMLYENGGQTTANINDYLPALCNVKKITTDNKIDIQVTSSSINLGFNQLKDIGLIVNELTMNAIKYAFNGVEKPLIKITVTEKENYIYLNVHDNGKGLPMNQNTNGFGLKFVQLLVKQYDGTLQMSNQDGAKFEITLKKLPTRIA
jgi:two-component sensor histidine kinase